VTGRRGGGELLPAAGTGVVIETFYTDGPGVEDWPAVGVHEGRLTLAFRPDRVVWPRRCPGLPRPMLARRVRRYDLRNAESAGQRAFP
jgi:hypothetical protein